MFPLLLMHSAFIPLVPIRIRQSLHPHIPFLCPFTPLPNSSTPHSNAPTPHPPPKLALNPSSPPPHKTQPHFPALLFSFLSSTLGSLIGAGGGILLTPLLTSLRLSQHKAHGTSLAVLSSTTLISTLRYSQSAATNLPTALTLSLFALITAPHGARFSARLNPKRLRALFGRFLLFVSLLILLRPYLVSVQALTLPLSLKWPLLAVVGALSGFLSGLLGIGGGTLNVPVLVLIVGYSQHIAQGTALMAMVVPCFRGAWAHFKLGHVHVQLLPALIVGALIGGYFGAHVALGVRESTLQIVCALMFAIMGVKYLRDGAEQGGEGKETGAKDTEQ